MDDRIRDELRHEKRHDRVRNRSEAHDLDQLPGMARCVWPDREPLLDRRSPSVRPVRRGGGVRNGRSSLIAAQLPGYG